VAGVELVALGWLWWRACFPVDAVDGAAAGVAGVALTELGWVCWRAWFHFAWHAWHLATSTSTSHGRCGTCGTGLGLVARLVPSGRRGRHGCWRARRGTWPHQPPLCVVSVPLGDIALHFAWHAWHLATSTFTLRDIDFHFARHRLSLRVASVALADIDLHFAPRRPSLCMAGVALGDIDLHFGRGQGLSCHLKSGGRRLCWMKGLKSLRRFSGLRTKTP